MIPTINQVSLYLTNNAPTTVSLYTTGGTYDPFLYTQTASTTTGMTSIPIWVLQQYANQWADSQCSGPPPVPSKVTVRDGQEFLLKTPDGTEVEVKRDGSYEIRDRDAKVIYRANRVREFNRFVNASDVLEGFIRFCGAEAAVRKEEMLELPIRLFIGWLILEAAKADKEPEPEDIKLLPDLRRAVVPRCQCCGRFLKRAMKARKIEYCSTACFQRQLEAA
jgi:hypothetical protein